MLKKLVAINLVTIVAQFIT